MAADPEVVAKLTAHYAARGVPSPAGLAAMHADKPLALLMGDPTVLLERLRGGEKVKDIAASYGVHPIKVYEWFMRNAPDEYRAVSVARSLERLEGHEDDLEGAGDMLAVSKAREGAKLAQWRLERGNRKEFGDVRADAGAVTVNVVLDPSCGGAVVDVVPVREG